MRPSKYFAAKRLTCDNRAVEGALPHKSISHERSTYFFPDQVGVLQKRADTVPPYNIGIEFQQKLEQWYSAPQAPFIYTYIDYISKIQKWSAARNPTERKLRSCIHDLHPVIGSLAVVFATTHTGLRKSIPDARYNRGCTFRLKTNVF